MKIEVDTVKGFQDFLPPESLKREAVKKVIEKYYKLYGFLPVETPVIEFDEVMRPDSPSEQDEAVSDRFRLNDRAGRNLGLRYEFTFQLARIFKQNPNIKLPFKRYQIGEVFRDEPTGSSRFRQFTQCDADTIGDGSVEAEAELLAMISDILKELKIDAEIQINNRRLMTAIIESVQITDVKNVMKELDKSDKIGEDVVKLNLKKYADPNQILTLFKLLERDLQFFVENAFDGAKELNELISKCKVYGIKNAKMNSAMVRGFSYYTGNTFEVKIAGSKTTIAGGGRFDKLAGKYTGKELPAVGISFGLERITELAKIDIALPSAILISIGQDNAVIKLAKNLRKENISCMTWLGKLVNALEFANTYGIQNVVFIGEEEIDKGKLKIRNMKSGEEKFVTEKQLVNLLAK